MEKRKNYKNEGLWVVKDHDGLYLCNHKPWKNFHDENDFVWSCEGDFIKINVPPSHCLSDMDYSHDPVKVYITTEDEHYKLMEVDDSETEFEEPAPMTQEEHDACSDQRLLYEHWAFNIIDATYKIRTTHKDDPIESITVNTKLKDLLQENCYKGIKINKKEATDTYYFIGSLAGYNIYVDETMDNTDYKFIIIQK